VHNWETKDPYMTAWVRLRQASDAAVRVTEIELGKHQTTLAQMDVLLILSMSNVPLSPGEISSYVFREKHSVSALLSRMQRAGYVKKVRSKKDQRVVKIQIQPKGRDLLNQSMPVIVGYARDLLRARFTVKEIKQFDRSMKLLRDLGLRELGTEAKRVPQTIEWEPEPLGQWQGMIKKYHAGEGGVRRVAAAAKSK
jgi:DNA-binding MarR family transcriptional regulator